MANVELEKALPSHIEAERAILGAILLDNKVLDESIILLSQEDFFFKTHQKIYDKMITLAAQEYPIDLLTLTEALRNTNELEQVGGAAFIASLIDGLPRTDTIKYYAKSVKSKARLRKIIRIGYDLTTRASDGESEPDEIINLAHEEFTMLRNTNTELRQRLFRPFSEFMKAEFMEAQDIALHTRRRELLLCAAITNRGKSTLLRNLLLTLSCGGEFKPFVDKAEPRRVLLADFESSSSRLQEDLARMTRTWPDSELELVRQNLAISCETMVGDDLFNLSLHMQRLEFEAQKHKADLIAIDTASAAFDLRDENNNSEVARFALKPLLKLARKANCCVWLMHHVGKGSQEEGKALEKAYKARGASAFGCYPATVFVLTATRSEPDLVTVTCAKRKDGEEYERVIRLNRRTRWFEETSEGLQAPVLTNRQIIRSVVTRLMQKAEIIGVLKQSGIAIRTIENSLSKDVAEGHLLSPRRGWYAPKDSPLPLLS